MQFLPVGVSQVCEKNYSQLMDGAANTHLIQEYIFYVYNYMCSFYIYEQLVLFFNKLGALSQHTYLFSWFPWPRRLSGGLSGGLFSSFCSALQPLFFVCLSVCLVFLCMVSLCSHDCTRTCSLDQTGLKIRKIHPPASSSCVLELKGVCFVSHV